MTVALRRRPELETGAALALRVFGYSGNAGRVEATFPSTLAFPRAIRPLTGILCLPPMIQGLTLCARAEVLDIGVSPPLPWGEVWGVRLRKPITGLSLWLEGPEEAAYCLAWACCFRFLGHSDPAGPGAWRTGLHGKDPLIALRVALRPACPADQNHAPEGPS
jgi:hypothetical protein